MAAGGYFGRALVVDAGPGTSEVLPLPGDLLRAYVGGAGLGAWLMHHLGPPGIDPLSAQAPLAHRRHVRYATISHDGRHAGRGGLGDLLAEGSRRALGLRVAAGGLRGDGLGHPQLRQPQLRQPGTRRQAVPEPVQVTGGVATPLFGLSALSVLIAADGYVIIPEEATGLDAGTDVEVIIYR